MIEYVQGGFSDHSQGSLRACKEPEKVPSLRCPGIIFRLNHSRRGHGLQGDNHVLDLAVACRCLSGPPGGDPATHG